jgi:hypothetical protein
MKNMTMTGTVPLRISPTMRSYLLRHKYVQGKHCCFIHARGSIALIGPTACSLARIFLHG